MSSRRTLIYVGLLLLTIFLLAFSNELNQNETKQIHQTNFINQQQHPNHNYLHPSDYPTTPKNHQDPSHPPLLIPPPQLDASNHQATYIKPIQPTIDQKIKRKLQTLRSLRHVFSTQNPIFNLSYKILTLSARCIIKILYFPLFLLFHLLNFLVVWTSNQIIFPMTFPIRLACWILFIKPIQILNKILNKLKPLIVFLISGITMGIFIGMMGSLAHLFIANRLFPIHRKPNKTPTKSTEQVFNETKKNSIKNKKNTIDNRHSIQNKDEGNPINLAQNRPLATKNKRRSTPTLKEMKSKGRKIESDSELFSSSSSEEEKGFMKKKEENWPLEQLESHLTDSIEVNKLGYSSAIQSITDDKTRKRSSSSIFHHRHDPIDKPASPQPTLNTRKSSHHPIASVSSYDKKINSLSPSNKKVTFKTD